MIKSDDQGLYYLFSSYITPVSFAIIKHWGQWHEEENIPINSNVGITLSTKDFKCVTSVTLKKNVPDQFISDGQEIEITPRIRNVLKMFQSHIPHLKQQEAKLFGAQDTKVVGDLIPDLETYGFKIITEKNYPTGSCLTQTQSGLAGLVLCLADMLKNCADFDVTYVSRYASCCESKVLFGPLSYFPGVSNVDLDKSSKEEIEKQSKRCLAYKIENSDWVRESFSVLFLQDQQKEKKVQHGGVEQTSELFQERVRKYSDKHVFQLTVCLKEKKVNGLMEIVMRDSNQFHATFMDNYPPLFYMNSFSTFIIKISPVHVGYSIDANANALLLIPNLIKKEFLHTLFTLCIEKFDDSVLNESARQILSEAGVKTFEEVKQMVDPSELVQPSRVVLTEIGTGPSRSNEDLS